MLSLLKHAECRVCGQRHHFCHPNGKVIPGQNYAYFCPEKGAYGTLRPKNRGEAVDFYPQGAVSLSHQRAA